VFVAKELPHDGLHPCRPCRKALAEIVAERPPVLRVGQNGGESRHDTIVIRRHGVLEPMQRLDDAHGRTSSPVQLPGSGLLEADLQSVELDRASARVSVDHDVRRNCRREAQVVRCRQAVDQHADLITTSNGVDDLAVVRNRRLLRQRADSRRVVKAAAYTSELARPMGSKKTSTSSGARAVRPRG
jgi:hypothetical protein